MLMQKTKIKIADFSYPIHPMISDLRSPYDALSCIRSFVSRKRVPATE